MTMERIGTREAMDQAFAGAQCHSVGRDGEARLLDIQQWRSEADNVDLALFVDPCVGTTLDIGCGPGRLAAALTGRGIPSMGIDMSTEAIRQARDRGVVAIHRNVFAPVPGEGRWDSALLADGNLGIGGNPIRLLRRVGELIRPGGEVIAEVDPTCTGVVCEQVRLLVGDRMSAPFPWASVGLDSIEEVGAEAGLDLISTRSVGLRHTAILQRRQR